VCGDAKPRERKDHNSRLTAEYTSRIVDLDDAFVVDADESKGWGIIDDPRPGQQEAKARIRVWMDDGEIRGVPHRKGARMLTWQVLVYYYSAMQEKIVISVAALTAVVEVVAVLLELVVVVLAVVAVAVAVVPAGIVVG
jgi:hypothetical protein